MIDLWIRGKWGHLLEALRPYFDIACICIMKLVSTYGPGEHMN